MPPALPATMGVPFHSVSETISPNPSRMLFWITTSATRWKAFTSWLATPIWSLSRKQSGSS